jgi:diadenylate cyclase
MSDFFNWFFGNIGRAFSQPHLIVLSIFDIIATFIIIYALMTFLKRNNAIRLFKYIAIASVVAIILTNRPEMPILGKLATYFFLVMLLGIFVLYTDDTKRILRRLYSGKEYQRAYNIQYDCSEEDLRAAIGDIVKAVQTMSKKNTGALIIIAPDNFPEAIIESGTTIDANLSASLIECLFSTKAPLHDGAVFIRGNKIMAAGCFLPLTQNTTLDKELGTRHRAAIGETEQYDSHLAIIVSEETGVISVARRGEIVRYYDSVMLNEVLEQVYGLKGSVKSDRK